MLSAEKMLAGRKTTEGGNLLKGSDLPKRDNAITVKVLDVREAPSNFSSPVILDIEEVCNGKTSLPLNTSNVRRIVEIIGDDISKLKGQSLKLSKVLVTNPKSKSLAWGLVVDSLPKRAPSKRKKA